MKFMFLVLSLGLILSGCSKEEIKQPTYPKYVLVACTYATTSKAGTVLEIKTVCRIEQDTGVTLYAQEGSWYRIDQFGLSSVNKVQ